MSQLDIVADQFSSGVRAVLDPRKPVAAFPPEIWGSVRPILLGDFLTAAGQIWNRPSFRTLATKPQRTLLPGCHSQERDLIDEVRNSLTAVVAAIRGFLVANDQAIREALPRASQRLRFASSSGLKRVLSLPAVLQDMQNCEAWTLDEWASADDYFKPTHETHAKLEDGTVLQRGELVVSLQPELTEVGNVIARCLMVRMGRALNAADWLGSGLSVVLQEMPGRPTAPWWEPHRAAKQLSERLRSRCISDSDAHLVAAAITVSQLYIALAVDEPDCEWLELPPQILAAGRRHGRLLIEHSLRPETTKRIAEALATIANHYRDQPAEQTAIEVAIASGGLVVIESTRQVYWETKLVSAPWEAKDSAWRLLSALARSRGLRNIGPADVSEDAISGSTLPNMKLNLRKMIPASLFEHIAPGGTSKPGTYRLDLQGRIHYFKRRQEQ